MFVLFRIILLVLIFALFSCAATEDLKGDVFSGSYSFATSDQEKARVALKKEGDSWLLDLKIKPDDQLGIVSLNPVDAQNDEIKPYIKMLPAKTRCLRSDENTLFILFCKTTEVPSKFPLGEHEFLVPQGYFMVILGNYINLQTE